MNDSFKALADPTRRQILKMLGQSELTAGEIARAFEISKPSISHHLSILKSADLVTCQRSGQKLIYSLNTSVLDDVIKWFYSFIEAEGDDDESIN